MTNPRFASHLRLTDSDAAIRAVVAGISKGLDGARPDLVAVFVSHHHGRGDRAPRPAARAPDRRAQVLIGCTGESIVGGEREVERGAALAVWAGVLPRHDVRPFTVAGRAGRARARSRSRAARGAATARGRACCSSADPFTFPHGEYLEPLNAELPGVAAIGGMASGGQGPGRTWSSRSAAWSTAARSAS